jgi:hypothetical protein
LPHEAAVQQLQLHEGSLPSSRVLVKMWCCTLPTMWQRKIGSLFNLLTVIDCAGGVTKSSFLHISPALLRKFIALAFFQTVYLGIFPNKTLPCRWPYGMLEVRHQRAWEIWVPTSITLTGDWNLAHAGKKTGHAIIVIPS